VNKEFLQPKYWPTWLGIGALRIFEPLPHGLLYLLGRGLGLTVFLFPTPFKRIARRNLELALPELVSDARERILREHFAGLGCALFETAISWWSSNERIRHITLMNGLEHLKAAQETGRGDGRGHPRSPHAGPPSQSDLRHPGDGSTPRGCGEPRGSAARAQPRPGRGGCPGGSSRCRSSGARPAPDADSSRSEPEGRSLP
jgi:hypothetical protein